LPAPHRIVDLARFMARELAPGRALPIAFTGLRPGDKEAEQFWSAMERSRPAEAETLLAIESPLLAGDKLRSVLARLRTVLDGRDLATALDHLQSLVSDYKQGAALLALAGGRLARVSA